MTQARRHVTSTQPEVGPIKIYSGPVIPFDSARRSNQPPVDPTLKIYGGKQPETIRVKLKGGNKEFVINKSEFNSDVHKLVE